MKNGSTLQQRFHGWLAGHPDDDVLRWVFRSVIAITVIVLGADLAQMTGIGKDIDLLRSPSVSAPDDSSPGIVPSILAPFLPGGDRRLAPMPQPDAAMSKAMTFDLVADGRLMASGTITPGISEAFAAEVNRRGDYIKTVVLNSPGGSVADALAMGKLIREKKFATEVPAGKYCASSCPLVFVGGIERRAGDKAAIGVHQVFSMGADSTAIQRNDMSDAQRISARCQRYLGDMGVNLQMWVHAMETPKDKLFIFKPDELKSLNIVTSNSPSPSTDAPAPRAKI